MADNINVSQGISTTIATDDVNGVHYQRFKLDLGGDGGGSGPHYFLELLTFNFDGMMKSRTWPATITFYPFSLTVPSGYIDTTTNTRSYDDRYGFGLTFEGLPLYISPDSEVPAIVTQYLQPMKLW